MFSDPNMHSGFVVIPARYKRMRQLEKEENSCMILHVVYIIRSIYIYISWIVFIPGWFDFNDEAHRTPMAYQDHEGKKNPDLVMLEAVHANSRTMLEDTGAVQPWAMGHRPPWLVDVSTKMSQASGPKGR